MRWRNVGSVALLVAALGSGSMLAPIGAAAPVGAPTTRLVASGGSTSLSAPGTGIDAVQSPEIFDSGDFDDVVADDASGALVTISVGANKRVHDQDDGVNDAPQAEGRHEAPGTPEVATSFDGLNHRNQRLANNGNQFSVEPPDQGMCAGNGFVMESVNDVLRVYDTAGNPLAGVVDLNTFYQYPPALNRATSPSLVGPEVTDPSCLFDGDTQRWFQVALTLDVDPATGRLSGRNHLDIAVSQTASPLGAWNIFRVPVQDDGTEGTPNHGCTRVVPLTRPDLRTHPAACLGDYPHVGADANAFFITTNEFNLFAPGFRAAQIYAFSKRALTSGAATIRVTQFDTLNTVLGNRPGHTVWPAMAPAGAAIDDDGRNTEFFLSALLAKSAGGTGADNRVALWALTNTDTLDSGESGLALTNALVPVNPYAIPPKATQRPGNFPLGQCINDTTLVLPAAFGGNGCWRLLVAQEPAHNEVISQLDSNDGRMQQVWYANGKLWGALDTSVNVGGQNKAGILFFVIQPRVGDGGLSGVVRQQGYVSLAGNNLTYPAIAALDNGRGVMAFSVVGADHFPSAAYVPVDVHTGAGEIHIVAEGKGPADGFTSYKAFVGNPPRTRWGDYGAAVVDGNGIWIASEYIAQTCTLAQYATLNAFGSCGGTRTSLGNWATRISRLVPAD